MPTRCLALAMVLSSAAPAAAEWQIKPFIGLTFGGNTTLVDLERAVGHTNLVFGGTGVLLGDVFGLEADFGRMPGFFQSGGQHLVLRSSATTLTGNIVVAVPRRLTQYTLRPYLVGGVGLVRAHIDNVLGVLPVSSTLPAVDLGGGATGFLTERVGLNWDIRYFHSVGGKDQARGLSFGKEQLAFWRASMAVAIRY
jgi:Outer membrane protein beta-barrel domain